LAIDPGKMTGWASFRHGDFSSGQDKWMESLTWFEAIHTAYDVIVCESFIITRNTITKSRQNWSLEAIGAIKYMRFRDVWGDEVVMQSPSVGKAFGTDDKVKAMGWWAPGYIHANDAARHLLAYAAGNPGTGVDLSPLESLL